MLTKEKEKPEVEKEKEKSSSNDSIRALLEKSSKIAKEANKDDKKDKTSPPPPPPKKETKNGDIKARKSISLSGSEL